MTETIKLMKAHKSVRRFKEQALPQEDLTDILRAAQMASSWKNFQSYSVIVVRSQEKKDALYELVPQEAIRQSAVFLLFVGDLNRAEKGARLHTDSFQPQGVEGLLISSVDAARPLLVKMPCWQLKVWAMEVSLLAWCVTSQKKWQSSLTCLTTPILSLGWHWVFQMKNMKSNLACH